MGKERCITNEEGKIRLSQYDRERLQYLLLEESGLKDKLENARQRLMGYVEKLVWKHILGDESCSVFPGCYRICKTTDTLSIIFKEDFGIEVPKFKREDLMDEVDNFILVSLSKRIPDIFGEKPIYYRNSQSFYTETRFANRIKKLASREELKTLENLIYEYISASVEVSGYLKELRTPARSSWRRYEAFGKFFNLSQLYEYSPELAFRMKYDILQLVDPEEESLTMQGFDKHPGEFSIGQNIDRLKVILGM